MTVARPETATGDPAVDLYIDLLKHCLTRYLFLDEQAEPLQGRGWRRPLFAPLRLALARRGIEIVRVGADPTAREIGRDRPTHAETMVGLRRLENVRQCVTTVLVEGVPGDLIETGVWRGGTSIFMRGMLAAFGETGRRVWVADSFQGLPEPDPAHYPPGTDLSVEVPDLAVTLEEVKANFERYGLLDDQVRFLVGWFKDTLSTAPIEQLAVLRLDGDYYESTLDALNALYPKLSPNGFVIVDDYGSIAECRRAVTDYRERHGITEEILPVDWTGAYWRKRR